MGRPADTVISAREAEVLAAVGEHLTNAEIAARLVARSLLLAGGAERERGAAAMGAAVH